MWYVIGGLVGLVLLYLFTNNSRNSDPLNRKCAAAVCEYVTTQEQLEPGDASWSSHTNILFDTWIDATPYR